MTQARSPIDQEWPQPMYELPMICPYAESEIAWPKWMDAMIRMWMYSHAGTAPPLREQFSYPKGFGG